MEELTHIVRNSGYTREALDHDLSDLVEKAKDSLPSDVDTLVGTGLSGTLVVPHLGRALGLYWGIMRKPSDFEGRSSYAHEVYEGSLGRKWALVDDFVSSGDTVIRVLKQMTEAVEPLDWRLGWDTEFQGVFQYSRREYNPWLDLHDLRGWVGVRRALDKIKPPRHLTAVPEVPGDGLPQAGHPGAESEAPQPPY